jgi:hypothetical protein
MNSRNESDHMSRNPFSIASAFSFIVGLLPENSAPISSINAAKKVSGHSFSFCGEVPIKYLLLCNA